MAMDKTEILKTANEIITRDRQATHGKAEDNFSRISAMWSAYTGFSITPEDVAIMMAQVKMARFKHNPTYADNAIDMAGYAALAGELATRGDALKPASNGADGE